MQYHDRSRFEVLFLRAGAGAALMAAVAMAGCSKAAAGPPKAAGDGRVLVNMRSVKTQTVLRHIDVVGTLWADEDAMISAKVAGKIVVVGKDVGDLVNASGELAQVSRTDYDLAINQKKLAVRESLAKIGLTELPAAGSGFDADAVPTVQREKVQMKNAEARFARGKMLFEQKPPRISEQEFDDLKTALDLAGRDLDVAALTARATLEEARSRQGDLAVAEQALKDATVKAPAAKRGNGTDRVYAVAARLISVGQYVKAGDPAFRLVDTDLIKLRAPVPERFASQIVLGQNVTLNIESSPQLFTGTVSRINPQVDPSNRTFEVEVTIPNAEHVLKPGSFVHAQVQTRNEPNIVFVPQDAVVSFAGVDKVFVVKDGKAQEALVTLGEKKGDWVEAITGLGGKEEVVVGGVSKLATGVAVKIVPPEVSATQPGHPGTPGAPGTPGTPPAGSADASGAGQGEGR